MDAEAANHATRQLQGLSRAKHVEVRQLNTRHAKAAIHILPLEIEVGDLATATGIADSISAAITAALAPLVAHHAAAATAALAESTPSTAAAS